MLPLAAKQERETAIESVPVEIYIPVRQSHPLRAEKRVVFRYEPYIPFFDVPKRPVREEKLSVVNGNLVHGAIEVCYDPTKPFFPPPFDVLPPEKTTPVFGRVARNPRARQTPHTAFFYGK